MSKLLKKGKIMDGIFASALVLMLLALLRLPDVSVGAARDGVDLCINTIIPSLFPFFVLSNLAMEMGLISALGRITQNIMYPLFRVNGSCAGAFLLGILGGYPVGARTAISLYEAGDCTKDEAERLLSFCNNSGPAFIFGVVGAGIFSSSKAGLWLYFAHVTASVLVGLCFRNYGKAVENKHSNVIMSTNHKSFSSCFPESVKAAFSGTLNICGFVIFFTVFIRLLFQTGLIPFLVLLVGKTGLAHTAAESLLTGVIEMTSGVWSLREMAGSMGNKLCMAAFILGWAGLSVHCQVLSFIGTSGLSTKPYFMGKLLHGLLSAVLVWMLSHLLNWDIPVSAHLASQVSAIACLSFPKALAISLSTASAAFGVLNLIFGAAGRNRYGKGRKNGV